MEFRGQFSGFAKATPDKPVLGAWPIFARLFRLWPHDVDRGGVKVGLDVRRVIFLDHLDAGPAVFGDLVDVGAFHQAETYICVPQAVSRSRQAFAVEPE